MDQKIIKDFIKKNIREYSLDEIREYLAKKNIPQKDIDDALGALAAKPQKNKLDIIFVAVFAVIIIAGISVLVPDVKNLFNYLSSKPAETEKGVIFRGANNFKLKLPKHYKFNRSKDKSGLETATFYPKTFSVESVKGRKKGVYRLNVLPRKTPLSEKELDLITMRSNHLILAKKQNLKFRLTDVKNLPFPAFNLQTYGLNPYTEIVMQGADNIYIFTSSYEDDAFYEIIGSLQEYY